MRQRRREGARASKVAVPDDGLLGQQVVLGQGEAGRGVLFHPVAEAGSQLSDDTAQLPDSLECDDPLASKNSLIDGQPQ